MFTKSCVGRNLEIHQETPIKRKYRAKVGSEPCLDDMPVHADAVGVTHRIPHLPTGRRQGERFFAPTSLRLCGSNCPVP